MPCRSIYNYQLFEPPYLFKGPRPEVEVGGLPGFYPLLNTDGANFSFTRDNDEPIAAVNLVKLSSTTHNFNMESVFVSLDIVSDDGTVDGQVVVEPPSSTCYATPGYYMLFAVSDLGVPSIGQVVRVTGSCAEAGQPALPSELEYSAPEGVNDLAALGHAGLHASATTGIAALTFSDLGRTVDELCSAMDGCPSNATIDLSLVFEGTDGVVNVSQGDVLDTASVRFSDGLPSWDDELSLELSSNPQTAALLGPGNHDLNLCATVVGLSFCIDQRFSVGDVLAGTDTDTYRAGYIEPRPLDVHRLPGRQRVDVSGDGVEEVLLPENFSFEYFGQPVDRLYIGANGGVRTVFGSVSATNVAMTGLSNQPEIAVWWDDLDPTAAGTVWTFFDGEKFVVAWHRVAESGGGSIDAQLHLYSDGRIEFHYPQVATAGQGFEWGASATVGLAQAHGTETLQLSHNDTALLQGGRAVAFSPSDVVASRLRLRSSAACTDKVSALPLDVEICGASDTVSLQTPVVHDICEPHPASLVRGDLSAAGEALSGSPTTSFTAYPGNYDAAWTILSAIQVGEGETFFPQPHPAHQSVRVTRIESTDACCAPEQTLIVGSARDDAFTARDATPICYAAQAGKDVLTFGNGDDTALGGPGRDRIDGGRGDDLVLGGGDDDDLDGGEGADVVLGGPGSDIVHGGLEPDSLWGGLDDDFLYGGKGDDLLVPGPGVDLVYGEDGDDEIVILHACELNSGEKLDGGPGTNIVWIPNDVDPASLGSLGVTVLNATVQTYSPETGYWGESECAP